MIGSGSRSATLASGCLYECTKDFKNLPLSYFKTDEKCNPYLLLSPFPVKYSYLTAGLSGVVGLPMDEAVPAADDSLRGDLALLSGVGSLSGDEVPVLSGVFGGGVSTISGVPLLSFDDSNMSLPPDDGLY
jgi:hypothetical protein